MQTCSKHLLHNKVLKCIYPGTVRPLSNSTITESQDLNATQGHNRSYQNLTNNTMFNQDCCRPPLEPDDRPLLNFCRIPAGFLMYYRAAYKNIDRLAFLSRYIVSIPSKNLTPLSSRLILGIFWYTGVDSSQTFLWEPVYGSVYVHPIHFFLIPPCTAQRSLHHHGYHCRQACLPGYIL